MKRVFEHIFRTATEHPFSNSVETCAYLVERSHGNILVYSSSMILSEFDFMASLGGVSMQALNHRDEASAFCDYVRERFNAPVICHEFEQAAVSEVCKVGRTISKRTLIDPDFEAIPTPGHCPGSTCYLWTSSSSLRYLFTGDTFYPNCGIWKAGARNVETQESLEMLRLLDVDVILPGLFIGSTWFSDAGPSGNRRLIEDCLRDF